jgi:hypothetical protein
MKHHTASHIPLLSCVMDEASCCVTSPSPPHQTKKKRSRFFFGLKWSVSTTAVNKGWNLAASTCTWVAYTTHCSPDSKCASALTPLFTKTDRFDLLSANYSADWMSIRTTLACKRKRPRRSFRLWSSNTLQGSGLKPELAHLELQCNANHRVRRPRADEKGGPRRGESELGGLGGRTNWNCPVAKNGPSRVEIQSTIA